MTTIGSSGGIAYQPGVCTSEKFLRTAIIKSYTDLETGEVNKHFEVTFNFLNVTKFFKKLILSVKNLNNYLKF